MTYQVLTQSMISENSEAPSMSDYAEAQRWAEAHQALVGLGEEAYDPDGQAALRLFGAGD